MQSDVERFRQLVGAGHLWRADQVELLLLADRLERSVVFQRLALQALERISEDARADGDDARLVAGRTERFVVQASLLVGGH